VKRKTSSRDDFLKTVARCNHPKMKDVHHRWLMGIALSASPNGEGSYPGYTALCEMTGRKFDRQRIFSNFMVSIGIVEVVSRGVGKGIANVYRICLENPAFPDDYTGQSYKSTSAGKGFTETTSVGKGLSNGKTPCDADQNPLDLNSKPLVSLPKPLDVGSDYQLNCPYTHPHPHESSAATQPMADVRVCVDKPKPPAMEIQTTEGAEKVIAQLTIMQPNGWVARDKEIIAWKKLLTEKKMPGWLFLAAAKQYIAHPPDAHNNGTWYAWQWFAPNINRYVAMAKEAAKAIPVDVEATTAQSAKARKDAWAQLTPKTTEPGADAFVEPITPQLEEETSNE
jgi:hypothetical protein